MLGASNVLPLFQVVRDCFRTVFVEWTRTVVNSIFTSNGALSSIQLFFVIGICISILFVAIKIIRSFTWGD